MESLPVLSQEILCYSVLLLNHDPSLLVLKDIPPVHFASCH